MNANYHSFTIGQITCTVLLDGSSHITVERFLKRFPQATEADYRRAHADIGLSLEDADSSLNVLAARIGTQTVLFDTGEAGKPNGGQLPESMTQAGIDPADITLVVITHTHGDHVQGILKADGQPAFPNATYVISQPELVFWQGRIQAGMAGHSQILDTMKMQGLRVIAPDEQIMPGLTAVPIPGHTPGQIALVLESEGEKLIHLADLIHSPIQFAHPEWSPAFDTDTSVSVPTRRAALARAADDAILALFYHLTFPGVGRVRRAGQAFVWET